MTTVVRPDDIDTPAMPEPHVRERVAFGVSGIPVLGTVIVLILAAAGLIPVSVVTASVPVIVLGAVLAVAAAILSGGLRFVYPFTFRTRVSTRIRNHETAVMKVNDADGNPVEIAAVVVWQVADTARAVFEVDDFVAFVAIQTETAARHIANSYPYDTHGDDRLSLRENATEITEKLSAEIAGAMLRRQQAGAVVAARQRIVEGAVGMVELALDREPQPVVNTGTLYQ